MDDIIQVIVILFFIFSIFGSVFGKKKPPQKRPQRIPQRRPGEVKTSSGSQYSSSDVLEELFGVKLPKTGNEYPRIERDYESVNIESEAADLETTTLDFTRQNLKTNEVQDINYDKQLSLEDTKPKDHLPSVDKYDKKRYLLKSFEIRKKFVSSSSLKDAILISEIINKPKSLRK
jgi:hypothetical protein